LKTFAIVPVKRFDRAKSRLGMLLNKHERMQLSTLLLKRTVRILESSTSVKKIVLVSSDVYAEKVACMCGAVFLKEKIQCGVNSAVDTADKFCAAAGADATIVLPVDLPLLLPDDIDIVCNAALTENPCIILCPSYKFDGSNILLRKPCNIIKTSYDANSYLMHVLEGIRSDIKTRVLFNSRLMIDIDTVQDITAFLKINKTDKQISGYLKAALARRRL
jgi:2-phospho-L-lactate/phosphoenolpyruvate guanylyltransferase